MASPLEDFLGALTRQAQSSYGERLISLAVFGSHASGRATSRSDIDLLVVLSDAAPRRRQRLDEFDRIEERLEPAIARAEGAGLRVDLSPVLRTREEAEQYSRLYLDMTEHVRVLVDRDDFLSRRLDRMRAELRRLGAERRTLGSRWYWVLTRDFRPGDTFEIT